MSSVSVLNVMNMDVDNCWVDLAAVIIDSDMILAQTVLNICFTQSNVNFVNKLENYAQQVRDRQKRRKLVKTESLQGRKVG